MKMEEAFRVAVVANVPAARLVTISRRCERAREQVLKILSPLDLGSRLEFGFHEEASGRGWLVVRIQRSGQQALFPALEGVDAHGTSPETASARTLLKSYITELKVGLRQLSGCDLEELAQRLPDIAKAQAAMSVRSLQNQQVSIRCGDAELQEFALSPLPGRHIDLRIRRVRFWIKLIGNDQASIVLPKTARAAAGVRLGKSLLSWDGSTVDSRTWDYLLLCMRTRELVQADVKIVLKANGTVSELLVVSVEQRNLRASVSAVASV